MFTPHPPAKLYKRFTNDMVAMRTGEVVVNGKIIPNSYTITVQNNRYVCVGKFKWIESTTKQDTDEQPLDGLIIPNSYLTIKTNSLKTFDDGDVVELPKDTPFAGYWIVTDGKETQIVYTPKPVQAFQFIPLSSVGLS